MKPILLLASLITIFLLSPSHVFAQRTGPHVIKGTVYIPGDRPAQRIEVILENSSGLQITRTFVDQDGRYAFPGLGFGSYRVVISEFGHDYARAWQDVDISGSRDSIIIRTVDLHLKPRAKSGTRSAPGTVSAFRQEVPIEAEEEYKKAEKALAKGPNREGLGHLNRAIEIYPDYYLALARLGTEYTRMGEYDKAVGPLRKACKINKDSASVQAILGMVLVERGEYREAIQVLKVSKALDSRAMNTHLYLAIAQMEEGSKKEAEESFRKASELGGKKGAVARLHLAALYDKEGEYDKAAQELESYLKEVPEAANREKIKEAIKRLREKKKGK